MIKQKKMRKNCANRPIEYRDPHLVTGDDARRMQEKMDSVIFDKEGYERSKHAYELFKFGNANGEKCLFDGFDKNKPQTMSLSCPCPKCTLRC